MALPVARRRPAPRSRSTKPARTASPIIREVFDELDRAGTPYRDAGKRAGIGGSQLSQWKHGVRAPKWVDFEAFLQACGYRLRLEKIPQNGPKPS